MTPENQTHFDNTKVALHEILDTVLDIAAKLPANETKRMVQVIGGSLMALGMRAIVTLEKSESNK